MLDGSRGPGSIGGLFLLALAVLPAFLLNSEPWKTIAVANAAAHLVLGLAWTELGTRYTRGLKGLALSIWVLTIPASLILLVAAIFVD